MWRDCCTQRTAGRPDKFSDPSNPDLSHSASWWALGEHDGDLLMEQLQEADEHVARLQDALKCEQEKCRRVQLRCHQQEAELSRREQHCSRLKERLFQLADGIQNQDIEVLNLPLGETVTSSRCATKQEELLLGVMLERREAELREAMKLRHRLTTLLHALRVDMEQTLLGVAAGGEDAGGVNRLDEVEVELGDHVTGGVVQSWMKVQRRLQAVLSEGVLGAGTDHDKILAQLQSDLSQSQQLVKRQQEMLQDSVAPPLLGELTDSYFLEEWERLQVGWAELESQRRTFDRERRAFTDAAIRLSHERRDFEQQKACLLKRQYLCECLRTPKAGNQSPAVGLDRPVPPPCSEVPTNGIPALCGGSRVQSPSTPELYAALRLNCRVGQLDTWDPMLPSPQDRSF